MLQDPETLFGLHTTSRHCTVLQAFQGSLTTKVGAVLQCHLGYPVPQLSAPVGCQRLLDAALHLQTDSGFVRDLKQRRSLSIIPVNL